MKIEYAWVPGEHISSNELFIGCCVIIPATFLLQSEKDIVILMSALLIVVILLPIIASYISSHLQDLFEIFRYACWGIFIFFNFFTVKIYFTWSRININGTRISFLIMNPVYHPAIMNTPYNTKHTGIKNVTIWCLRSFIVLLTNYWVCTLCFIWYWLHRLDLIGR